jgi:hypothetical protein
MYHDKGGKAMAKFNQVVKTGVQSPIKTVGVTKNADGFAAFQRDTKSELFLLAVSNFVGQDMFYENAKSRDDRFAKLCQAVAVQDVDWYSEFVYWLRNSAQMRSASIVAAAEGAKAILDQKGPSKGSVNWPRRIVALSMARADEPGEFLAYWTSKYGKAIPAAVKKGVADATRKLYNEYSLLKYDTDSKGFRFADVLQLTHAKAKDVKQNDLFGYALNRRYGNDGDILASLEMISNRETLMRTALVERRKYLQFPEFLKSAGMTWEALAGWLQGPMDAQAWEAVIPNMGYMALLRNLRNFQEAGVNTEVFKSVLSKLADADEVAKSRQFPFRFLSAYQANQGNLKIAAALEEALESSLINVPALKGKTLILVDRSGSMFWSKDDKMGLTLADQAAIFGSALALRAESATLVEFDDMSREIGFRKGDSVLKMVKDSFKGGGGTATSRAIQKHFQNHDRVILITDEQYNSGSAPSVPKGTPMYTWNLGGYQAAHAESGSNKKHTFGGLTDKAFSMIPMLESGIAGVWPWDLVS